MGNAASTVTIIETMKDKFTYHSMNNGNNDNNYKPKKQISSELAEFKAQQLIDKYNSPQSRNFFLKCIYHLPEYEIEQAVETAMRPGVKSNISYFTVVAKQKLAQAGF